MTRRSPESARTTAWGYCVTSSPSTTGPDTRWSTHSRTATTWLIAQHSDRDTASQRECSDLLAASVAADDADAWHSGALLEDRVLIAQEQPHIFGTQLKHGPDGVLARQPLCDPVL